MMTRLSPQDPLRVKANQAVYDHRLERFLEQTAAQLDAIEQGLAERILAVVEETTQALIDIAKAKAHSRRNEGDRLMNDLWSELHLLLRDIEDGRERTPIERAFALIEKMDLERGEQQLVLEFAHTKADLMVTQEKDRHLIQDEQPPNPVPIQIGQSVVVNGIEGTFIGFDAPAFPLNVTFRTPSGDVIGVPLDQLTSFHDESGSPIDIHDMTRYLAVPEIEFAMRWREHLRISGGIQQALLFPKLKQLLGRLWAMPALDGGCGNGFSTQLLLDAGAPSVVALDQNFVLLGEVAQQYPPHKVTPRQGNLTDMPFHFDQFGSMLLNGVLINMPDDAVQQTLREARRVVREGGIVVGMVTHPLWDFVVTMKHDLQGAREHPDYEHNQEIVIDSLEGVDSYTRYRRPESWYREQFRANGFFTEFEEVFVEDFPGISDWYKPYIGQDIPLFLTFKATNIW